jgi:hypothetical protein
MTSVHRGARQVNKAAYPSPKNVENRSKGRRGQSRPDGSDYSVGSRSPPGREDHDEYGNHHPAPTSSDDRDLRRAPETLATVDPQGRDRAGAQVGRVKCRGGTTPSRFHRVNPTVQNVLEAPGPEGPSPVNRGLGAVGRPSRAAGIQQTSDPPLPPRNDATNRRYVSQRRLHRRRPAGSSSRPPRSRNRPAIEIAVSGPRDLVGIPTDLRPRPEPSSRIRRSMLHVRQHQWKRAARSLADEWRDSS